MSPKLLLYPFNFYFPPHHIMSSSSRSRVFAWRICIEQSCDETYVADLDSICLLAYEFKNIQKRSFSLRFNSLILDHLGFVSHGCLFLHFSATNTCCECHASSNPAQELEGIETNFTISRLKMLGHFKFQAQSIQGKAANSASHGLMASAATWRPCERGAQQTS